MKSRQTFSSITRPAATVILTREQAGTFQVYLLKRNTNSKFMAGNFVFPGGTVEDQDRKFEVFKHHIDWSFDEIDRHLGGTLSGPEALSYSVAAIRETLEEAGVFLAHRQDQSEPKLNHIRQFRLTGNLPKDWFAKEVVSGDWQLAISALSRWSHWITPKLMNSRFDTRFLVAIMPADQFCQPDCKETVAGLWISPKEGLEGNLNGSIPLSPPTLVTLHQLLPYPDLKSLQVESQQRQWGQPVIPRLVPLANGALILEPWDPMYLDNPIAIRTEDLTDLVLAVGEPFSRIWYDGSLWKPVGI
jgi:8-oxo-dGTP pyrophosphatase MutT (NUDIX family)